MRCARWICIASLLVACALLTSCAGSGAAWPTTGQLPRLYYFGTAT